MSVLSDEPPERFLNEPSEINNEADNTPCFSPESLELWNDLAGLLAYAFSGRPSHPTIVGQWLEVCRRLLIGIYSYGDSAGLTPDFPFNDPLLADQPNSRQM